MQFKHIFDKIHPLSIKLIQNPIKQNINDFKANVFQILSITNLDVDRQKILEFLVFPLITVLNKHNLKNDMYEDLFQILIKILTTLNTIDSLNFSNLINISSIITKRKLETTGKSSISEEYYIAYLSLIKTLFDNYPQINEFYSYSNLTTFGLLISLSLDILCYSNSLEVQLACMDSLESISGMSNEDTHYMIGSIFASFLPGISIKIIQNFLINSDLKLLNHKIIVKCLDYLSFIISKVLNDVQIATESCQKDLNNNKQVLEELIIDRQNNRNWIKVTSEKLNILLVRLFNALKEHQNYLVRMSLIRISTSLICNCFNTLKAYLNTFLETIVTLSVLDTDEHVLNEAKMALDKIQSKFLTDNSSLPKILSENLEKTLLRLSERHHETSDTSQLKLIYSYLTLVDDLNNFLLVNFDQIAKLLKYLVGMIKFDTERLEHFYVISTNMDTLSITNYSNDLSELFNDENHTLNISICHLFGKSNAIRLINDYLLDQIDEELSKKLEVMTIVILILHGLASNTQLNLDEKKSLVEHVLINFISNYKRPTRQNKESIVTLDAKHHLIIEICLIIKSIELSSNCLKEHFVYFLMDTLSILLETYMSDNLLIKSYSRMALAKVAFNLNHAKIEDLLSSNYDYLINDLYLNIRKVNLNQSKLDLLCALVSICNKDIVSYLMRLIDEIVFNIEISENYSNSLYLQNTLKFIIILGKSMRRWFNNNENPRQLNIINNKTTHKIQSFVETIQALQEEIGNARKSINDFEIENETLLENDDDDDDDDEQVNEEPEKKPEIHIQIQTKCLELCIHTLLNPSKEICFNTLEIIEIISYNLIDKHQNELLPLIHKIWSSICSAFKSDSLIIKLKIVHLLFHLTKMCGDFLSARFVKELLPKINDFMQKQAQISARHTSTNDTTYIYSHSFKLQSIILTDLPFICTNIEIDNMVLENLIKIAIFPYLDKRQPTNLQLLAIDFLSILSHTYSDIIWLCLHYIVKDLNNQHSYLYSYIHIQLDAKIREKLVDLFKVL